MPQGKNSTDPDRIVACFAFFSEPLNLFHEQAATADFTVTQCGSKMPLPEPIKAQGNKNYGNVTFSWSWSPTPGTKSKMTACPFRAHITYFYPSKHVGIVDEKTP